MPPSSSRRPGRPDRRTRRSARPSARPDPPGPPRAPKPLDPLLGHTIAGHKILQSAGTGDVCKTYKAHHAAMARDVAFKTLKPDADDAVVAGFYDTAKAAAQVHHPNIASIYDVSSAQNLHFCTMEYVEGRSVGELLKARQKIASDDAIRVAIDAAEGLRFANAKGMPGFRLSADHVVLSSRGEVKIIPPTLTPPDSPVLDDSYVLPAIGTLLYAMLSGGRVADLEAALAPGSDAPAQLQPIKKVAMGTRQDIAAIVDRLVGAAGAEPYPNLDAALADLRTVLEMHEQAETRTRSATERARERKRRGIVGIAAAIAVGLALVALIATLLLGRKGRRDARIRGLNQAKTQATASITQGKKLWAQFWNAPSRDLANATVAQYQNALKPYQDFQARFPNTAEAQEASYHASAVEKAIDELQTRAAERIRHVAERNALMAVRKAFETEVARKLQTGGTLDAKAWAKRYGALANQYPNSPYIEQQVTRILRNLKAEIQRAEMKIETNQLTNDFREKHRPKYQYGKALAAWERYRQKYDKLDHLRKQALSNYETKTDMIKRDARIQCAQLLNHANYLANEKKDYARAREIYKKIADNFGIKSHVDKAKEALRKLPK